MDEMSFRNAEKQFFEFVSAYSDREELASKTVEALSSKFSHYSWVGIYWLRGKMLELGPWKGPEATQHTMIEVGSGICGSAAMSGQMENVPDVNSDSRYLSCFTRTKSEIVVPLFSGGKVVGEIDIDGDDSGAFVRRDEIFLKKVADLFDETAPGAKGIQGA